MSIDWGFGSDAAPTSLAIADRLEALIRSGDLSSGARLPTQRALAKELAVSLGTVGRAIAELQRRGLVRATVGRGTFVRESFALLAPIPPSAEARFDSGGDVSGPARLDTAAAPAAELRRPPSESSEPRGPSPVSGELGARAEPALEPEVDLGWNRTFVLPLEVEALARTLRDIAEGTGLEEHGDGVEHADPARWWPWLTELGYACEGAQAGVVASAQHAASILVLALARPGQGIVHGDSVYPGLRSLAERLRCPLLHVEEDDNGPRPDRLEAVLAKHDVAFAYWVPTLSPIGNKTIMADRRAALVRVARAHGLTFVEDEDDGLLLEERPVTMQSLAPELGIGVIETSKAFATGSRIGFLVVPEHLAPAVEVGRRATLWSVPWLPVEVVARWIEEGLAARAMEARREALAARQAAVRAHLAPWRPVGPDSAHTAWLDLPRPWSAHDLVRALSVHGIRTASPESYAGAARHAPSGLRLCLGGAVPERLGAAAEVIARILHGPYRPARTWERSGSRVPPSSGRD